jgi:hypothetical protein
MGGEGTEHAYFIYWTAYRTTHACTQHAHAHARTYTYIHARPCAHTTHTYIYTRRERSGDLKGKSITVQERVTTEEVRSGFRGTFRT